MAAHNFIRNYDEFLKFADFTFRKAGEFNNLLNGLIRFEHFLRYFQFRRILSRSPVKIAHVYMHKIPRTKVTQFYFVLQELEHRVIRRIHFSRNPKIAQYMHEYDLVKEFGEGVDRLFREMESAGNPAPEYKLYDFMLKVKLSSAYRETFSEEINNGIKDGGQRGSQTRGQRGSQTDYRSDGQIGEIAGLSVNQGGSQTGGQKGSQTTIGWVIGWVKSWVVGWVIHFQI